MELLKQRVPEWDGLPAQELRRLWLDHVDALYPGVDRSKPQPACYCGDAAFVHPVRDVTVKGDVVTRVIYGEHIPCRHCAGWSPEERKRRIALMGIPEGRQQETLSNFRYREGADDAFTAAEEMGSGKATWCILLLYGVHGNGKTHLARGAMLEAVQRHVEARYFTVRQLMATLRMRMDTGGGTEELLEAVKHLGFLVLDELGTEDPKSDWQAGVIEDIINHRYDHKMPTILIQNGDLEGLKTSFPGILSRLWDSETCRLILNGAPDYRPKKGLRQEAQVPL